MKVNKLYINDLGFTVTQEFKEVIVFWGEKIWLPGKIYLCDKFYSHYFKDGKLIEDENIIKELNLKRDALIKLFQAVM